MKRILFSSLLFLLCTLPLRAQQAYTINGYVTDAVSSETLISATVLDVTSGSGVVTNEYGHYSITLPSGNVTLQVGYVGYKTVQVQLTLTADTLVNIQLPLMEELDVVEIVGNRLDLA